VAEGKLQWVWSELSPVLVYKWLCEAVQHCMISYHDSQGVGVRVRVTYTVYTLLFQCWYKHWYLSL